MIKEKCVKEDSLGRVVEIEYAAYSIEERKNILDWLLSRGYKLLNIDPWQFVSLFDKMKVNVLLKIITI